LTEHDEEHEERPDDQSGPLDRDVAAVGAGGERVGRAHREHGEAREVHGSPQASPDALHQQRRDLDGDQQVEAHDAPRDRAGTPCGRERKEHLGDPEVDVVVGDESCDVDRAEDERERTQMSM
jgi:hypothetical protein